MLDEIKNENELMKKSEIVYVVDNEINVDKYCKKKEEDNSEKKKEGKLREK